ncbi:hypothetical protein O5560_27560, partial [Escherichia coli]|nr:hypothetical protein [Escherichia coli]
ALNTSLGVPLRFTVADSWQSGCSCPHNASKEKVHAIWPVCVTLSSNCRSCTFGSEFRRRYSEAARRLYGAQLIKRLSKDLSLRY